MKNYNVIFLPSFSKMFENTLNNCKKFSPTYAIKIRKSLYNTLEFLKIFPYATFTIKFRGNPQGVQKICYSKKIFNRI